MSHPETVQGKDAAESFREWIRMFRKRDEIFHMTRGVIGKAALAEIQKGSIDQERLKACFMDIEDGFLQNLIDPQDIGLTWESWRELCRTHGYEGEARKIGAELKSAIEEKEKSHEKYEKILFMEEALRVGDLTLEDMEMTPEEWEYLCEKYNYHSVYRFHCAPALFYDPHYRETREVDKDHDIEIHLRGAVATDEKGYPMTFFKSMAYLRKKSSGEIQILCNDQLWGPKRKKPLDTASPREMADQIIEKILMDRAQIVIETQSFKAQILQ